MAKRQLHPGAKWMFRLNGLSRFGGLFVFLFVFFFAVFNNSPFFNNRFGILIFLIPIFVIVFFVVLAEIYARMSYNRWFYEFTGEQLRMERGIIWKKYSNIPYERVQNVDITRGIIARMFGFSSVNIQTAGYSMPFSYNRKSLSKMSAEGYIPAVSAQEAEHIREFLMKKISS